MAYAKQTWEDEPSTVSPTSAARFNFMEAGIEAAHLAARKDIHFPSRGTPTVGRSTSVHTFPRAEKIVSVRVRSAQSPTKTPITVDWRWGSLATLGADPATLPFIYAANPADRPSIDVNGFYDKGGIPGKFSFVEGDYLIEELISVGTGDNRTVRSTQPFNSGSVAVSSFAIPLPTGRVAGDALACLACIGGASDNPLPLVMPSGWTVAASVSSGEVNPNLHYVLLVKDTAAANTAGDGGTVTWRQTPTPAGTRPVGAVTFAMSAVTPGVAGVDVSAFRIYDGEAANNPNTLTPESPDITTTADVPALVIQAFAARTAAGTIGTQTYATATPPGTPSNPSDPWTEVADWNATAAQSSWSSRTDQTNFGIEASWRSVSEGTSFADATQRRATYTPVNTANTPKSIAAIVSFKGIPARPGMDVTAQIETEVA